MILIRSISKSFNSHTKVLNQVSFELHEKECLAIVGSSGSGKTTLLRLLNRLISPDSGVIYYNSCDIRMINPIFFRRLFGNVFQQPSLFPHLTVQENVALPLCIRGISKKQQKLRSEELLQFVKLDVRQYSNRFPHELSGGEQQRVNLARALIHEPEILLMDEPLSALDAVTRQELQKDLLEIHRHLGKTILFITHDLNEAMLLADRIAVLHHGNLEQIDEKNRILSHPKTHFVKQLLEKGLYRV